MSVIQKNKSSFLFSLSSSSVLFVKQEAQASVTPAESENLGLMANVHVYRIF